jgi:2-methylcitrate dehydratase PrpD
LSDTALHRLARWAHDLRLEQIPQRVRDQAVNQILSTLAAVYSGYASDLGPLIERAFPPPASGSARIIPTGVAAEPSHAAMLMASWSMVLDFDDVRLGGHTGHSSVLVPLAFANGHSGADLLLAQIVANEIAARINMVCAVGSTRGQMATHLHLVSAAAARAKLEDLDADTFAETLAFALSYPAQALYPAFLGSDAKALCAAYPIRVGTQAVDAVRAGLRGGADVLDDARGFFATTARVSIRDFLGGLGERWHTETNSYKIYPACGYLCAALDAVLDLVREHDVDSDDVVAVDVWSSIFTIGMDAHSAPYLDGPRSRISTLTFSTPFTIASAILAREFTPAQLHRAWIDEAQVWRLAARVRSRHDLGLTLKALTADIPIGAGLRRVTKCKAAAFAWSLATTARLGPLDRLRLVAGLTAAAGDRQPMDFRASTKPLGARVEIRLNDGRVLAREASIPRGFAGSGSDVRELMREKLMLVNRRHAADIAATIENIERLPPSGVAHLIELMCRGRAGAPFEVAGSLSR